MNQNLIKPFVVAGMTLLALGVFGVTLTRAVFYAPEEEAPVRQADGTLASPPSQSAQKKAAPQNYPDRLIIPSISLDANVQYVGIAKSGNLAVPTNYTDVAWYKLGSVPGEAGSAVIDGHVDNGFALAAVFKNLSEIQPGDDIYVERMDGTKVHFVVSRVEDYLSDEVPKNLLFDETDGSHLNLITCAGDFDPASKSYDHRLVVYSDLAS